MLFLLSKTIGWITLPTNFIAAFGLVGVLLAFTRYSSLGRRMALMGCLLFAGAAISPIGNILAWPLEVRFPSLVGRTDVPDGIIVLGGAIDPEQSQAYGLTDVGRAAGRITAAVDLWRRFPNARLIYTSGNPNLVGSAAGEAVYAKQLLVSLGVNPERIEIEDESRNTWENAAFTKKMVRPEKGQRWILVTSALHMPRAVGCFRHADFEVTPYPVDWRTRGWPNVLYPSWRAYENLALVDAAVHEWIGLLVYWLDGKSSAIYPGPTS